MLAFVGQFLSNFKTTGAILPSGSMLARAMTRPARRADGPRRLLEVGPGTGAFTKKLLDALEDGDELHIVEINRTFADYLERKLLDEYRRQRPLVSVRLHCASIEEADLPGEFDYVICGLPFNNFPVWQSRTIFRLLMGMLREGGQLTYFEYAGVRYIKAPVVGTQGRRHIKRHRALVRALSRRHEGRKDFVFANVPPAYAMHLTRRCA
jgi:phospholipid N-methyltransferase